MDRLPASELGSRLTHFPACLTVFCMSLCVCVSVCAGRTHHY